MSPFLRCFSFALPALLLLGALLNFLLDPLGHFRNQGMQLVTYPGERVWGDERVALTLSIDSYRPDTLIVGNSRVRHGFARIDGELREQMGETRILGLPGANFDEMNLHARRVLANHSVQNLVLGLDLEQFLLRADPADTPAQAGRPEPGGAVPDPLRNLVAALWSEPAFRASVARIFSTPDAQLNGAASPEFMRRRLDRLGHAQMARRVEAYVAQRYAEADPGVYEARMAALDALLAHACADTPAIRLFISPIHVRQLLLIRESGHLDQFFAWKAQLADIVSQHQAAGCQATLTDFSTISRYTSEAFPEPGDKRHRMQWYWESSHYNHRMGQMILERLWSSRGKHADFGRNLDAGSVNRLLEDERKKLGELLRLQAGFLSRPLRVHEFVQAVSLPSVAPPGWPPAGRPGRG